ncbi:hypothetical protein B0T26DRAFT_756888 [Lasiosphaeria miniovina]|uniref:HNH nuclease domain-containing protein n=1 Tax=Lasiosphaeria miniovina TaxID=1954250 RepID=A0AA39ZTI2_9PEZI|nr:uncharacterized protein B0T26DRAFT_756888 [Lasiosphaeria miniovina]KAK0703331.1 hypothetical protein B0T26DRAFT_756888 [Lasiosphaeria miniovina]
MEQRYSQLFDDVQDARKKLEPSGSFDAKFWSEKAHVLAMDSERVKLYTDLLYQKYIESGGVFSRGLWDFVDQKARDCVMESIALAEQAKIAKDHANKADPRISVRGSSYVKLFKTSNLGFGLEIAPDGQAETDNQLMMRNWMKLAYCAPKDGAIWEPVLGQWIEPCLAMTAQFYSSRSADFMDDIFGTGAHDELFSLANGVFLHHKIKEAFDKGFLVIVPDTNMDPKNPLAPWEDREERSERLREWEMTHPRQYRIAVLDATPRFMSEWAFSKKIYTVESETLAGLHGRRLTFLNDARPRARYVWWGFLRAVTQLTWRESAADAEWLIEEVPKEASAGNPMEEALKGSSAANLKSLMEEIWKGPSAAKPDSLIEREVLKGVRYWGTPGKYVKEKLLCSFVHELGHDASFIAPYGRRHREARDADQ